MNAEETPDRNPYAAPSTSGSTSPPTGPTRYDQVPPFRRNGVCSGIIILHLIVGFASRFVPLLGLLGILTTIGVIAICFFVLTGPIYYNRHKPDGTLEKWSGANKVAAVIILILFVGGYGFLMYWILTKGAA